MEQLASLVPKKTHEKYYTITEYVNDINRENAETLMELAADGSTDAVYTYGFGRVSRNISDTGTASACKTKASTAGTGAADGGLAEVSSYYLYDGRGSVAAMADAAGTITNSYQYDAYGSLTFGTPVSINYYGYNAESSNTNTGLQYLRVKYYNPVNGNFTSEDTEAGGMTNPLTQNRYDYVTNNPLNYADPTGHKLGDRVKAALNRARNGLSSVGSRLKQTAKNAASTLKNVGCRIANGVKNKATCRPCSYVLIPEITYNVCRMQKGMQTARQRD